MTVDPDKFDIQEDYEEYLAALRKGVPRKHAWKERFNGLCAPDYALHADVDARQAAKSEHARRKAQPVYTGFVRYFPDAMGKVAELSLIANEQHHPGTPLHWDKSKSQDHNDCIIRHMIDDVKGIKVDDDDVWHKTKVAWRAMAELQEECDREAAQGTS